eukprot:10831272-Karenia_brevis.AAC.1
MAYQPHSQECRKKFEEILENDAKVRSQRARMEEFEERERRRREKKESRKEEENRKEREPEMCKNDERASSSGSRSC